VEADVSGGQEGTIKLVALAEKSVQESVSRIQAALRNSGYRWADFGELSRSGPKVTINLAPADVKKDSAAFDLPIATRGMAIRVCRESSRPGLPRRSGEGGRPCLLQRLSRQ